jgi:hypothetical protein
MDKPRLKHPDLLERYCEQNYRRVLGTILKERISNNIATEKDIIRLAKITTCHRSASTITFAFNLLQRIVDGYSLTPKQLAVVDKAEEQMNSYSYYMPSDPDDRPCITKKSNDENYHGERYINDDGEEVANGRDRWGEYTANYSKGYTTYGGMGGTISFDHETGEEC